MNLPRLIVPLLLALSLFCCKPEKPTTQHVKERAVSPAEKALARQKAFQSGTTNLSEEQLNTVLAEGEGVRVTLGDMMKAINQMPTEVRQRYQSPERWPELLQELVAFEILLREADEAGLARDPMVLHTFKSAVADRYLQEKANLAVQPSDITEAMVSAAHASRPELSTEEALVHAFVFSSDKEAQSQSAFEALKKVEGDLQLLTYRIPEQISALGDATLGVGESGDAGFINAEGKGLRGDNPVQMVPPKFAELLFKNPEEGVLVGPVHTDRGYMLGFIKSFRPERQLELAEVAASIRNHLLKEKRAEFRAQLETEILKEAGFVIDENVLSEAFPASAESEAPKPEIILSPARMRPLKLQHNDMDKRRKMLETTIQEELESDE